MRSTARYISGADRKIIADYLGSQKLRKLHIGSGYNALSGWLNSDVYPTSTQILRLNATQPFPFKDNVFHYVFSEHMIEHITYPQGLEMLAQCYRVLVPNGKIRIATPNLAFLVDLYRSDKSELQKEYLKFTTDKNIEYAPYYEDIFAINNFVRNWGHQFIYDEKTLRYSLEKVGFTRVCLHELGESEDEELVNLENVQRIPEAFLRLQTFVLEGTKPD